MDVVRGKRARITKEDHLTIAEWARDKYPDMPRTKLAEKIANDLFDRRTPPEIEVLEKLISRYRNAITGPEDEPWSLATLDSYPIPPEALPAVLEVFRYNLKEGLDFTIRQAKWASRLSAIWYGKQDGIPKLALAASRYAHLENLYQVLKMPLETFWVDRKLFADLGDDWYSRGMFELEAKPYLRKKAEQEYKKALKSETQGESV
jgi:hypothetical protein